ncbi:MULTISPECIES: hypothetical protein [Streptomyces]|uniref:hypothetical protein n=1 Tax=Streptomyces TaxID=1883 RepID=UPI0033AFE759
MRTCHYFTTIRTQYEREIGFMLAHAKRYEGSPAAKSSAKQAASAKQRMARALSGHVGRCPECG